MKKFLCLITACSFLLLAACGGDEVKPDNSKELSREESHAQSETTIDNSQEASFEDSEVSTESFEQASSEESLEESEDMLLSGDFGYTLVNTVAMICAYKGKEAELSLPTELDGYTVTAITDNAFKNNTTLKKLTVSDTIVNIGEGVFNGCSKLEYVFLGSGVAVLQTDAFDDCVSLKEIEVSSANKNFSSVNGVLYNGDKSVLLRCPRATEEEKLDLPDTVTLIEKNAFSYCKGLKKVKLSDGCKLSQRSFYYCMDLEEIEFGDNLTEIPQKCFFGCVMFKEIVVPDGVTSIGDYAFFGCISATKAVIPESVEEIGDKVFKSCSALKKIEVAGEYGKSWYDETGKDYINA